ncbi:hypothetical protein KPH14_011987 [Odynerus spinipes]|uniref:ATP-binding cassette sub-family B member 10, mitochondrial n=1 Tax=Odynerus spinipes TaxID=1348599 RepID=A0AAD9RC84_9HYME|nr:hypothetical protein KPH14_011987 [Odynerus spinipes]
MYFNWSTIPNNESFGNRCSRYLYKNDCKNKKKVRFKKIDNVSCAREMEVIQCYCFLIGVINSNNGSSVLPRKSHRITYSLRKKAYAAILSQETAMFDTKSTGELVGRLTGDAQLVSSAVTSNVSDGLRSAIMTTSGISMMFYVSPNLALVSLSMVPVVAGMAIIYGRFLKRISRNVQDSLAALNAEAEERISNIRIVKASAQEIQEVKRYTVKLQDVLELCYKESLYRGMFFGITGLSGNAIVLSVLYYGGVMVSDSTITVGNLSAFLLYAAYVGISMNGLSSFYSELNKALGASTRLFELIDRKPKIPIQGGSGKSTVALLLLRLYDPCEGRILLDNHDLRELDPMWVKSQIGVVPQESVLFSGTIRDNIIYEKMKDGLNTIVGERGITLSGGQRQRIAIARALVKKPKILILDEATSALDAESEHLVQEALERAVYGKTVLTIAHRLSTIKNADNITVINQGQVVETGTYSQLINLDQGYFKNLVKHQAFM